LPDSDLGSFQGPGREIEDLDSIHPINWISKSGSLIH
jgi:hypothetical protein